MAFKSKSGSLDYDENPFPNFEPGKFLEAR